VLHVGDSACSQPLPPTNDVIDLTDPSREADKDLMHCLRRVSFV
jgi:hypothetical protein